MPPLIYIFCLLISQSLLIILLTFSLQIMLMLIIVEFATVELYKKSKNQKEKNIRVVPVVLYCLMFAASELCLCFLFSIFMLCSMFAASVLRLSFMFCFFLCCA